DPGERRDTGRHRLLGLVTGAVPELDRGEGGSATDERDRQSGGDQDSDQLAPTALGRDHRHRWAEEGHLVVLARRGLPVRRERLAIRRDVRVALRRSLVARRRSLIPRLWLVTRLCRWIALCRRVALRLVARLRRL